MSEKALRISLADDAFVTRLLHSALNLYDSIADADPALLEERIRQRALDFESVLQEGAEEIENEVEMEDVA